MANIQEMIELDFRFADGPPAPALLGMARQAQKTLLEGTGPGSDFLGWLRLPCETPDSLVREIEEAAQALREAEALVVIGIGGSYLGAKAVIEALRPGFSLDFPIHFAGHQLDARYHKDLLEHLSGKDFALNVISKSGTTTEPGLAFRLLYNLLEKNNKYKIKKRIIVTTDGKKGALRSLAEKEGLPAFVIPDDVGGRFSVFTPVGLLPIAAAGLSVRSLLEGAQAMQEALLQDKSDENPALLYAAYRNGLYQKGKKIEILASYQEGLRYVAEWWKQLFGESEGKEGKGLFPASVVLSTDLHSMGQWMQEGERNIFETVLDIREEESPIIPKRADDTDGLNYLGGRSLHEINRTALQATLEAHHAGGVPCLRIELPCLEERSLGALLYFFEFSCGISAYMLGVNPFDQPGVEAYKKNMFRLLGKPGYR